MAKEAVNIKGTRQGLVILFDADRDFEAIKAGLQYKMESSGGFFSGAKCALYGSRELVPAEINELETICRNYGLIPDPDVQWPPAPGKPGKKIEAVPPPKAPMPGDPALLVKRTLRSGQVFSHPGHITVLGNVHPGAEVVAGGSILVMGTCSGFLQAGAGGDASSCIVATAIQKAHLRITDKTLVVGGRQPSGGPVIAQIRTNQIIISPFEF